MSTVKANSIYDLNGGSNAQLYGVASPPNSMGFRNRLINSDMRIDQRNNGASVTPSSDGTYTLDRWVASFTQGSKFSVQQNAGSVTPPSGFTNYLGVTSTSAYSVGSGDTFVLAQYIEGFNIADLGWGTANAQSVTLSFWVRSSLTGTFGGALANATPNRSYPFSYVINSANTWEQKSITIAGDTTGSWGTNNTVGLRVRFGLGSGSTFSGTAGVWAGSNLVQPTGSTSVVGTNGATFYITGVQLEAGTNASPFERRDYGRELMMCQRYFEVSASDVPIWCGNTTSGATYYRADFFKVTKRAAPTVTPTNSNANGFPSTASTVSGAGADSVRFVRNANATVNGGFFADTWTASAEL